MMPTSWLSPARAAVLALMLCPAVAAAQATPPAPSPSGQLPEKGVAPEEKDLARAQKTEERPWAQGVAPEHQQRALALFAEANGLLRDAVFVKAAETYREALRSWDHPAIHYNLALALVNLDQPVEMFQELEKAMAYGAAPLDDDKYERARQYKLLVAATLASVEISCATPGARVFLDGKELFVSPGSHKGLIRIGEHTVLAKGTGYAPTQLSQKLGPGEVMRLELKLFTDDELTRERRAMPAWVPWVVLGGGAVVVGAGGFLHAQARDELDDYDAAIQSCAAASPSGGCANPGARVLDKKNGAENKQTLAITAYALGGVAIATGVVLAVINRPESYRIDPFAEKQRGTTAIAPLVGPDLAGVSFAGRF
jgi:tetratricopeptide (TPR) repeat protein